jgi:DNA-binding PadR family transcriptional regulator
MSPVFRHGRLRLYLLKLLDEAPRHGYEIIRLLQDRFLGVYAPSPGTIYPRLARLEEEGLVTHDETDGKKVYRITDKGREELRSRLDDLAELEDTITASVRDIAREVTEDVRETVRSLREELAWAVRDVQSGSRSTAGPGRDEGRDAHGRGGEPRAGESPGEEERARRAAEQQRLDAEQQRLDAEQDRLDAERARLRAERERARARWERGTGAGRPGDWAGGPEAGQPDSADEKEHAGNRGRARKSQPGPGGGGPYWRHGPHGGDEWGDWGGWGGWHGWSGRGGWPGHGPGGWADPRTYRDLERLAKQFSRDLRAAAWHAQTVSDDAVRELRQILDDAISRIKDAFGAPGPPPTDHPGPGGHRDGP